MENLVNLLWMLWGLFDAFDIDRGWHKGERIGWQRIAATVCWLLLGAFLYS